MKHSASYNYQQSNKTEASNFLVAQLGKNLSAMLEAQVWFLGQEDPLEKEMATHSSILAWRIPWTEEPGRLQSMELQRVGHDWATNTFIPFSRKSSAGVLCRVHHVKYPAGWITSWNQDCWEKYQQPQICRWYHSNGRKWRGTKEPFDEGERGKWKSWLQTQHSKTKIMACGPITSWQIDG